MPHQDTDAETPRAGHHVHFTLTIQSSRCDFTQEGCAKAVKPRLVQVPGQPVAAPAGHPDEGELVAADGLCRDRDLDDGVEGHERHRDKEVLRVRGDGEVGRLRGLRHLVSGVRREGQGLCGTAGRAMPSMWRLRPP